MRYSKGQKYTSGSSLCPTCGGWGYIHVGRARTRSKKGRVRVLPRRYVGKQGSGSGSIRVYWPSVEVARHNPRGVGETRPRQVCPDPWHQRSRPRPGDSPPASPDAPLRSTEKPSKSELALSRRQKARRHTERQGKDRR